MVKRRSQRAGSMVSGRPMFGGNIAANAAAYNPEGAKLLNSQYYTINGGSKKRSHKRKRGSKRTHVKKGGNGVIAAAAVPFGLLALQRYFKSKGKKTAKKSLADMSRSVRRTFRRKH